MINLRFQPISSSDKEVKLSAIFKADNFVYTTFDENDNLLSYHDAVNFDQFSFIQERYPLLKTVKVAVKTPFFGHFGDINRIPFDQNKMLIDKLTGSEIWCAYESPFTLEEMEVKHFSTLVHHHFYRSNQDVFFIHFDPDQMHFYVQKEGQIVLYNSYPFEKVDDLLYYHSFIAQSLDVDTQNIPLHFSGHIEFNSIAFSKLSPFHNVIKFIEASKDTSIVSTRSDLNLHHFFDHIANIKCV